MSKTNLYAFGSNGNGQLGVGNKDDVLFPSPCSFSGHTNPFIDSPQMITGGGNHSAVITNKGELWMSGLNTDRQCGLPSNISNLTAFEKVVLNEDKNTNTQSISAIKSVACGWTHTIISTERGDVYAFGKGSFGELGCGPSNLALNGKILRVEGLANVCKVACGLRHSVALTTNGVCFGWGSNRYGQLGTIINNEYNEKLVGLSSKSTKNIQYFSPVRIAIDKESSFFIADIACGRNHTVVLSAAGDIYTFGNNKYGQLGYASPHDITHAEQPRKVSVFPGRIVEISCGWSATIARNDDGQVIIWGRNDHGQLGIIQRIESEDQGFIIQPVPLCYIPKLVVFPDDGHRHVIAAVTCGSEHSLAITTTGQCLTWGWNEHGSCGSGNTVNVLSPKFVNGDGIISKIGAGCGTSWIWISG
ncbi:5886_t:CDS:1 [Ambispora gerdemannii]|uniref:5886_t:CDS:1 n=1 Tax=Ambispora gerdemannii TaxID=144530 RepID=A0A9N9GA75_9GLOM|nr:5886_t:CDS:1 [Ambispora gerdemannii]